MEKADFFEGQDPINKNSYKEYLTYDKNGNIQTLNRTGALISHQPVEIDELVYVYQGNQVQSITDATANSEGFSDGNTQGEDYVYDEFGNLVQDKNKDISSIGYNHLNLPVRILFSDASSIHYVYDAMGGRKSKKVQPASGAITTADYQDIFQYENGVLQFFSHTEGYTKPHNEGYLYVYQYKDHLGNIRLSYADIDGNGSIDPASEILEENNYYPFGLQHQGYNELAGNPAYKYKYNGKELQEIGMYDYGARFYMPDIGRWLGVDPLAEKFPGWSPYNYTMNNPINLIDPTGMAPEDWYQNKLTGDYEFWEGSGAKDGYTHLGESSSVNVNNSEGTQIGTVNLNADGSVDYVQGDNIASFNNTTVDLGFVSGNRIRAGNWGVSENLMLGSFSSYTFGAAGVSAIPFPKIWLKYTPEWFHGGYGRDFVKGTPFTSIGSFGSRRLGLGGEFGRALPGNLLKSGMFQLGIEGLYDAMLINSDSEVLKRYDANQSNNPYRSFVPDGFRLFRTDNKQKVLSRERLENNQKKNPYRGFVLGAGY